MGSLNEVRLIGHLGAAPEKKTTKGGAVVVSFSLATNKRWRDKETNENKERTEWHQIVVWGNRGESCAKHLHKGSQVFISGELQTTQWEKDGQRHYSTRVVADDVQFLDPPSDKGTRPENAPIDEPPPGYNDEIPF